MEQGEGGEGAGWQPGMDQDGRLIQFLAWARDRGWGRPWIKFRALGLLGAPCHANQFYVERSFCDKTPLVGGGWLQAWVLCPLSRA